MSEPSDTIGSGHPQIERLLATTGKRELLHSFVAWLMTERDITLYHHEVWGHLDQEQADQLVEQFFGIDHERLAEEEAALEVEHDFKNGRQP